MLYLWLRVEFESESEFSHIKIKVGARSLNTRPRKSQRSFGKSKLTITIINFMFNNRLLSSNPCSVTCNLIK